MNTLKLHLSFALITLLILLFGTFLLSSCSKDVDEIKPKTLFEQYDLLGKYRFRVTPLMMGTMPITTGKIDGTITDEGNGILRLRYNKFRANPMPFEMTVDLQFTITEKENEFTVHNVEGKSFFNADPPAEGVGPIDIPGIELPPGAEHQGLKSNGKSKISGFIKKTVDPSDSIKFNLKLDPAVGLPVVISILSLEKLD